MPYTAFHERFPEVAEREVRNIILFDDPEIPDGEYSLVEFYCDEPDCDCRRVMFNVVAWRTSKIVAVIVYGWESKAFYAEWYGRNDPEALKELKGPALNSMSRQSKLAPALLEKVTTYVLQDEKYVNRLKRHYQIFRKAVEQEQQEGRHEEKSPGWFKQKHQKFKEKIGEKENERSEASQPVSKAKIGRNAPCPCGSGKKYKKCCGK